MPAPEIRFRYQKAVLWPKSGLDRYGQVTVSDAPVELDVRWVGKKSEVMSPNGSVISVDATAVVDRDIEIGSRMWHGELEDWFGSGSGSGIHDGDVGADVMTVITFNKTSDVRNRAIRRTVGLKRFRAEPT